MPEIIEMHNRLQMNLFFMDYRGLVFFSFFRLFKVSHLCFLLSERYGNSAGYPTERGLAMDAEAALNYVLSRRDVIKSKIFVFGTSLGGAVAIRLTHLHQDKLAGVIVENTFTSIDDMVLLMMEKLKFKLIEMFRTPLYFYLTNHWSSKHLISTIQIPILFISGLKDELIPPTQMSKLFELCKSPAKELRTYPEGEHNNTFESAGVAFFEEIVMFCHRALSGPKA
eukprot:TRINITY_DN4089_c0_g1_i4.p1 TRINITY_DN4089_c0_g1~~TRINITY_DN4089_c0_g1_i4.p1  ORF type:complete len:225 (-),score=61.40 TRINITY_DN4089_c0_g1_i4:64-738(-)